MNETISAKRTLFEREARERWATIAIWLLIVYTFSKNILAAAAKPFWFDELCTVAVARQPSLSAMWRAFGQAEDSATPLFWLIEHYFGRLIANHEIAYRLPSILGFACILWCLFVFVRTRSGPAVAFLCALVPTLTPLYKPYAVEARGYSLVVACISVALVCYQRAPRWFWVSLMALSLMGAEAFHYYGLFGFLPFGLAELTFVVRKRKVRWGVWLALLAGFAPLAFAWSHLMQIKSAYGPHYWGRATLTTTADAYGLLLRTFAPIAFGVLMVLSVVALWAAFSPESFLASEKHRTDDNSHESVLVIGLLGILLAEFVAARIAHGQLEQRYALAIALGLAVGTSYLVQALGRRSLALVAIFVLVAFSSQEAFFWLSQNGHLGRLESPAAAAEALVATVGHEDLPVVVSDGQQYVQVAYYASAEWRGRFLGIVDPDGAVAYAGSDTLDRQMFVLPCCLPLRVYEFQTFALAHPKFLLYSNGADFDWWPRELLREDYSLRLLAVNGGDKIYLADKNGS